MLACTTKPRCGSIGTMARFRCCCGRRRRQRVWVYQSSERFMQIFYKHSLPFRHLHLHAGDETGILGACFKAVITGTRSWARRSTVHRIPDQVGGRIFASFASRVARSSRAVGTGGLGLHRPFRHRKFPTAIAGVLSVGTSFPAEHLGAAWHALRSLITPVVCYVAGRRRVRIETRPRLVCRDLLGVVVMVGRNLRAADHSLSALSDRGRSRSARELLLLFRDEDVLIASAAPRHVVNRPS